MSSDVEETLERELHEVASALQIPAMPPLPQKRPRAPRHWQPFLVAASVVLVVAGAVAVVAAGQSGQEPQPAPSPSPSPSRSEAVVRIPRTAPTIPYLLDERLYVGGEQVPGTWWSVRSGASGWLALRTDNTWWWGRDRVPNQLTGIYDVPPVISPDGRYIAQIRRENGAGVLTGFATGPGGKSLGSVPIDLGDPERGGRVSIRAVTDDGRVIAQGTNTSMLWLPLAGNRTIDLTVTAPGQQILAGTPAGLVVNDGAGGVVDATMGEPYLAELSDAGELTRLGTLPTHDDLLVSPGSTWLVRTPAGTTGGEVTAVARLEGQTLDGVTQVTLSPPAGWSFRVRAWAWEDDDYLVSPLEGQRGERMARCSLQVARCVLVKAP